MCARVCARQMVRKKGKRVMALILRRCRRLLLRRSRRRSPEKRMDRTKRSLPPLFSICSSMEGPLFSPSPRKQVNAGGFVDISFLLFRRSQNFGCLSLKSLPFPFPFLPPLRLPPLAAARGKKRRRELLGRARGYQSFCERAATFPSSFPPSRPQKGCDGQGEY